MLKNLSDKITETTIAILLTQLLMAGLAGGTKYLLFDYQRQLGLLTEQHRAATTLDKEGPDLLRMQDVSAESRPYFDAVLDSFESLMKNGHPGNLREAELNALWQTRNRLVKIREAVAAFHFSLRGFASCQRAAVQIHDRQIGVITELRELIGEWDSLTQPQRADRVRHIQAGNVAVLDMNRRMMATHPEVIQDIQESVAESQSREARLSVESRLQIYRAVTACLGVLMGLMFLAVECSVLFRVIRRRSAKPYDPGLPETARQGMRTARPTRRRKRRSS